MKKSKRLKAKATVKEEDDIPHTSAADTQQEEQPRVKQKVSNRSIAGRLRSDDGGWQAFLPKLCACNLLGCHLTLR